MGINKLLETIQLETIALACKNSADGACLELVDDTLHTDIGTQSEEQNTDQNDNGVEDHGDVIQDMVSLETDLPVSIAHAEVGKGPKNEAEPAVEEGGHDGKNYLRVSDIQSHDSHGGEYVTYGTRRME